MRTEPVQCVCSSRNLHSFLDFFEFFFDFLEFFQIPKNSKKFQKNKVLPPPLFTQTVLLSSTVKQRLDCRYRHSALC